MLGYLLFPSLAEYVIRTLEQLLFPLVDLRGVNAKLGCQFVDGFIPSILRTVSCGYSPVVTVPFVNLGNFFTS